MFIKQEPQTRMYKVIFEHLKTNKQGHIYVEAIHSSVASETVLDHLGKEYDLVMCIAAKPSELH